MANVDMIPRSYREARRARALLTGYGMALAALLLAGAGASALLHWRLSVELPKLEALRGSTERVEAARSHVATAQQRKTALSEDVAALAALRGVGAMSALATALDGALNDRVWLDRLVFSRTLEQLREPSPEPLPGVVVRTRAAPTAAESTVWRRVNHVEMGGSALDHGSLTAFLGGASASRTLHDVRFLKSSVATIDEGQLVEFSIAGPLGPLEAQP